MLSICRCGVVLSCVFISRWYSRVIARFYLRSLHATRTLSFNFRFPCSFSTRLHGYTSLVALLFVCICISFFTRPPKNWKSLAGTNFGRKTGDNATKMYRQTHNSNYEARVWVNGCVAFKTFFCSRFQADCLAVERLEKIQKITAFLFENTPWPR